MFAYNNSDYYNADNKVESSKDPNLDTKPNLNINRSFNCTNDINSDFTITPLATSMYFYESIVPICINSEV